MSPLSIVVAPPSSPRQGVLTWWRWGSDYSAFIHLFALFYDSFTFLSFAYSFCICTCTQKHTQTHTHTHIHTHTHTYTYTHEKIQKKSNYPLFLISETKKKYKIDTHMMYKHTSIHKHKPTHSHTHINARGEGRGREKIWIISFIMNAGRALNDSSRASKSCQILPNGLQSVARWCSYHFLPFSIRVNDIGRLNTLPSGSLMFSPCICG